MPLYRYTAVNALGERHTGERDADSPQALATALERDGWTVLEMDLAAELSRAQERLSTTEAGEFAQHLAGLTESGLPLPEGLRALAEELPRGRLRRVVFDLARRLERGQPLEKALEEMHQRFPSHLAELVLASVRSGRVGIALGEFATYSQIGAALRRQMWLSLTYPIVLLAFFTVLVSLFCIYVVRSFQSIFADFGVDLPGLTKGVLIFSNAVTQQPLVVLVMPLVALAVLWVVSLFFLDAAQRRRFSCRVPLFGPLLRWTALAEFCHDLGLLVECEVPLPQGVELAAQASHDAELVASSRQIAADLEAGHSLADAVASTHTLPLGMTGLLRWADKRMALSETLHMIGQIFEAQARTRAEFVTTVVTAAVVIFVVMGVAISVVALFLPLLQLISKLSG